MAAKKPRGMYSKSGLLKGQLKEDIKSGKAKMTKQEVPFGGVGRAIGRGVMKATEKLAEKDVAIKIANTKPVAKATEVAVKTVKKATSGKLKDSRKEFEKRRSETIARNSVKVRRGDASEAKRLNELANKRTQDIASGNRAARESANVKNMKPAKVVKINSAPAKSADAAKKAADAKALKAANKKKK